MLKYFTEKDGKGGFLVYWCLGPACPRSETAKKLCKQRCNTCIPGQEGETLQQLAQRIVTVAVASGLVDPSK